MGIEQTTRYGMSTTVDMPHDITLARTRAELAAQGFGVLSEIDIADTMHTRLGVDFRPYVILGACNPPLAHRALQAETDLGLLLPCNVVVYATDDKDRSVVAAMDPEAALELTGNSEVQEVAREVRVKLEHVLEGVASEGGRKERPHYDGRDPDAPLPDSHFDEKQKKDARQLGDGSPAVEPRRSR